MPFNPLEESGDSEALVGMYQHAWPSCYLFLNGYSFIGYIVGYIVFVMLSVCLFIHTFICLFTCSMIPI